MLNKLLVISVLLFGCGEPAAKNTDEHEGSSFEKVNLEGSDLEAKELFRLSVTNFFKDGSVNQLEYGESTLKFLVPSSLYVDTSGIYFIDESRQRIVKYSFDGSLITSYSIPVELSAVIKLYVDPFDRKYLLDANEGLFVYSTGLKDLIYHDEKTIDFYVDSKSENIYLDNNLDGQRAIFDIKKSLKSPLQISYHSVAVEDGVIQGLKQINKANYLITEQSIPGLKTISQDTLKSECDYCIVLPTLLAKDLVLSSRNNPFTDQISVLKKDSTITYLLNYTDEISTVMSEEVAGYSYTGYFYFYDTANQTLFSLSTDKEFIRFYKINLKGIM